MAPLFEPLLSSVTPLDGHSYLNSSSKGCKKEVQQKSKRTQNQGPREVTRNVVWIQYLLRFGHIEPSRNNFFLLSLGCTPLGKKASPEKFSSTYAPGGSDGHLELPSVIFGSQLGPHWDGKFHPNLQMCAPFAHNLGNLCGGCVV